MCLFLILLQFFSCLTIILLLISFFFQCNFFIYLFLLLCVCLIECIERYNIINWGLKLDYHLMVFHVIIMMAHFYFIPFYILFFQFTCFYLLSGEQRQRGFFVILNKIVKSAHAVKSSFLRAKTQFYFNIHFCPACVSELTAQYF